MRSGWKAWVLALSAAMGLVGCPEPKSDYTYPGCENRDGVCSRDITVACAVNAIDDQHSSCVQDSDCVEPPALEAEIECVPVTFCRRRLVNVNEVEAYLNEARAEVQKYCSELSCSWFTSDSCFGPEGRPACVEGQCQFVLD